MAEYVWKNCPICGSGDFQEIKGIHGIGRCNVCAHEFRIIVPYGIKRHYYGRSYWENDKNRQGIMAVIPSGQWAGWLRSRIGILERFALLDQKDPGRYSIYEFGCAEGMLLYELKMRGYQVKGNDVCEIAEEGARVLGLEIDRHPVEEIEEPGAQYDLVMSFHVLEHLRDPKSVVLRLGGLLKEGGNMLMHVPVNDAEYGNEDHFHFFSEESCRKLMAYVTEDIRSDYSLYHVTSQMDGQAATFVGKRKRRENGA